MSKPYNIKYISLAILAIFLISTGIYIKSLSEKINSLTIHLDVLEKNLASTTVQLQQSIDNTHTDFAEALKLEKNNSSYLEQKLTNFQSQVGTIKGTVTTLEKLSRTDPQLLSKYSKVFFLSENYIPSRLTEIPVEYRYIETKHPQIHTDVLPFLQAMLDDAGKEGVKIYVSSAYRSFNEQQALKGQYKITYGAGTANQFSADQGYSEHQLGTALDFITTGTGGQLDGFEKTKAYEWLTANAYRYGFIISYPKDNKFYVFEPWHWRYVGIKLATDLHTAGQNFYEWDQRKIDSYLVSLFE